MLGLYAGGLLLRWWLSQDSDPGAGYPALGRWHRDRAVWPRVPCWGALPVLAASRALSF